jgi:hypothetical protein
MPINLPTPVPIPLYARKRKAAITIRGLLRGHSEDCRRRKYGSFYELGVVYTTNYRELPPSAFARRLSTHLMRYHDAEKVEIRDLVDGVVWAGRMVKENARNKERENEIHHGLKRGLIVCSRYV